MNQREKRKSDGGKIKNSTSLSIICAKCGVKRDIIRYGLNRINPLSSLTERKSHAARILADVGHQTFARCIDNYLCAGRERANNYVELIFLSRRRKNGDLILRKVYIFATFIVKLEHNDFKMFIAINMTIIYAFVLHINLTRNNLKF